MLNKKALKAAIVLNGMTQGEVAAHIGISEKTFISRMKRGSFWTDECEKMIALLQIKDPSNIFFAKEVT